MKPDETDMLRSRPNHCRQSNTLEERIFCLFWKLVVVHAPMSNLYENPLRCAVGNWAGRKTVGILGVAGKFVSLTKS